MNTRTCTLLAAATALAITVTTLPDARAKLVFELGLRGGLGLNNANLYVRDLNDLENYLSSDTNARMGYSLALEADLSLVNRKWIGLYIELAPGIITKGYYMPGIEGLTAFGKESRLVTLSYFQIPLGLKVRVTPWLYVGGGMFLDILMSTGAGWTESLLTRSEEAISLDKNPAINKAAFGWLVKLGGQIRLARILILFGEVSYQYTISNLHNDEIVTTGDKVSLRAVTLQLGLRFRFSTAKYK